MSSHQVSLTAEVDRYGCTKVRMGFPGGYVNLSMLEAEELVARLSDHIDSPTYADCEIDPVLAQEKIHDEWYEQERRIHNAR